MIEIGEWFFSPDDAHAIDGTLLIRVIMNTTSWPQGT